MIAFLDESFPLPIAFGSRGGPERRTEVVTLASGRETRNARWADSRRRYDAGSGIRSLADLRAVVALFERARGRMSGFRFRDPFDHSSALTGGAPGALNVALGTGTGSRTRFELVKVYGSGPAAYARVIDLPVAGSLKLAVNGTELPPGGFSFDAATREVVLATPPATGAVVTAGFLFDVPVRFDTDSLDLSLTHFEAGEALHIPLVEIRLGG